MLHLAELLPEAVAVLRGLAATLPQVGHHRMRRVAAERHGALGPRAEQPLRVERREEGRAVVQVAPLDDVLVRVRVRVRVRELGSGLESEIDLGLGLGLGLRLGFEFGFDSPPRRRR